MSNLTEVLNYAASKVGIKEGATEHKNIINEYNAVSPKPAGYTVKHTDSWCAAFVTHIFDACGLASLITRECSCGRMIAGFQEQGIWVEDQTKGAKVGDIIMYDWDGKDGWPEHVGIVERVSGTTLTVIEGNYSDSVKRRTISTGSSYIRGYGRPNYDGATANTTTSTSASASSSSSSSISVDGKWGTGTTTKAQKVFGTTQDGTISNQRTSTQKYHQNCQTTSWKYAASGSSALIKAIQKKCGISQDGLCGINTAKAIQKLVGTTQDGYIGANTVKAFQTWLNKQ